MEQLSSHWTDFHEILYLRIFRNSVEKIDVLLKSDKNNRYLTRRTIYVFYHILLISSLNEKYFKQNVVEKIETHFVFQHFLSIIVPFMR